MSRKHLVWLVAVLSLLATTVGVARAGGRADLRVTTLTAPPKVIGAGVRVSAIVGIENYGGATAPRSKGKLLLSSDKRPDSSDRVLKQFTVRTLPSRGWLSQAVRYTVPAKFGSWYVIACLDVTHAVRETSEKNNCRTGKSKMLIDHPAAMPVVTGVTPASPSSDQPTVHGTGPVGTWILVYTNATCSGAYVSNTKAVPASGTWSAPVPLHSDGTYVIYAKTHWWSGDSACSTTFGTYTRDTVAPPTPTNLAITGGGSGSDTTPTITGTTQAGATVKVFSGYDLATGACKTPLGSTVAGGDGHFSWDEPVPLSSPDDTYRTYYLMAEDAAGNPSNCTYPKLDYLLS